MPGMATEQPRQPVLRKPLAPAADKRIVAVQLVADLRPAMTRLQQQDQPGRPSSARPLRLAARWFSSICSASVSPILLFMNTIVLPFYALHTTSYVSRNTTAHVMIRTVPS